MQWIESIGPGQAMELVQTRLPNTRSTLYEATQREFAERMVSGKWQEFGISRIILDEEGRLADGVQQMMAVFYAGIEVEFIVSWEKCEPWFPVIPWVPELGTS